MRLRHFSKEPLTEVQSVENQKVGNKPKGLWVDAPGHSDGSWKEWCEENEFHLDRLTNCCEIVLECDANILHLGTVAQLEQFEKDYGTIRSPFGLMQNLEIDWDRVASLYDGIVISPYQRSHRGSMWYYGWDIGSGCIWNASAINRLVDQRCEVWASQGQGGSKVADFICAEDAMCYVLEHEGECSFGIKHADGEWHEWA